MAAKCPQCRVDCPDDSSFCGKCGGVLNLHRRPSCPDWGIDDISPKMFEAIGINQQRQCNELIILALHRHRRLVAIRGI